MKIEFGVFTVIFQNDEIFVVHGVKVKFARNVPNTRYTGAFYKYKYTDGKCGITNNLVHDYSRSLQFAGLLHQIPYFI